jgi:hypothetical protein
METRKFTNGESKHQESIKRFFIGETFPVRQDPHKITPKRVDPAIKFRKTEAQIIKAKIFLMIMVIFVLGILFGLALK